METKNENVINGLNNLIEINNDRVEGYKKASEELEDTELKPLFYEMARKSREFGGVLTGEVRTLGGTPAEGTKTAGKFYRVWMDVKAAFAGHDKKAILETCEYGEDAAQAEYEDVLKSEDLNTNSAIKSLVLEQKASLREDHDKIKSLRDAARASN